MKLSSLSRRTLLQGAGAGIAATALPLHRAFAKDVVVGLVYVGPATISDVEIKRTPSPPRR